jgi:hypothetical protein
VERSGGGGNEIGRGLDGGTSDKMRRKNRKKVCREMDEIVE